MPPLNWTHKTDIFLHATGNFELIAHKASVSGGERCTTPGGGLGPGNPVGVATLAPSFTQYAEGLP